MLFFHTRTAATVLPLLLISTVSIMAVADDNIRGKRALLAREQATRNGLMLKTTDQWNYQCWKEHTSDERESGLNMTWQDCETGVVTFNDGWDYGMVDLTTEQKFAELYPKEMRIRKWLCTDDFSLITDPQDCAKYSIHVGELVDSSTCDKTKPANLCEDGKIRVRDLLKAPEVGESCELRSVRDEFMVDPRRIETMDEEVCGVEADMSRRTSVSPAAKYTRAFWIETQIKGGNGDYHLHYHGISSVAHRYQPDNVYNQNGHGCKPYYNSSMPVNETSLVYAAPYDGIGRIKFEGYAHGVDYLVLSQCYPVNTNNEAVLYSGAFYTSWSCPNGCSMHIWCDSVPVSEASYVDENYASVGYGTCSQTRF